MELLENKNLSENIISTIIRIDSTLLSSIDLSETELKDIINTLTIITSVDGEDCLNRVETVSMLLLISRNKSLLSIPIISMLNEEAQIKLIKNVLQNASDNKLASEYTGTDFSTASLSDCNTNEKEQYLPSFEGEFKLPAPGDITNLTVSKPDKNTGKCLIKEVMIDHNGYVVKEISRRYEDMITDGTEEIYTEAYLRDLEKSKDTDK